jgi:hypothetical protein
MSRLSSDFYAVAPLYPSDKVAARVAGRGEHFEFTPPENHTHSDLPIATRAPTPRELSDPFFTNWTGTAIGRFLVTGIMAESPEDHKRWVVRCVCGCYEIRKSKFIKKSVDKPSLLHTPMCGWCAKTRDLQRGIGIVRDGPLVKAEDAR